MKTFFAVISNMRNRHYLVFDLIAMLVIPTVALSLRLDESFNWSRYGQSILFYTLLSIIIKLPTYYKLGLYKHLWRYASIEEISVIVFAVFFAAIIFNLVYLFLIPYIPHVPEILPRSVPSIDALLSLLAHGGIRLFSRFISTTQKKRTGTLSTYSRERVLIIGAGNSGTMIAKEMLRHPSSRLQPVGFVDDDPDKKGAIVSDIEVLGARDDIPDICKKLDINKILIAMPSASGRSIREILRIIKPLNIKTRTLPGVSELLGDIVELRQLREIRIDDLLRRDPVKIDLTLVKKMLLAKRVLVTGAGGSIGAEICRHIAQCGVEELILLGHGENSIHSICREIREAFPNLKTQAIIADIRDEERVRLIMRDCKPSVIYHAAAHKHVPLMEENMIEAVTNNVMGTINMLKCAQYFDVQDFILISTDKAVSPSSVMGVTKRMAEIALQISSQESQSNYIAVRFGNVLGSRGSVVPVFMNQIEKGGPITITHPEMKRYFMTIPEAVQLVLQASTFAGNGQIYVLDMGEPERILDLAKDLIYLAGYTPFKDVDIVFTGQRSGEKISEALFREGEIFKKSKHEKIFSVIDPLFNGNGNRQNYLYSTLATYEEYIRHNILSIDHSNRQLMLERITEIVPEFSSFRGAEETCKSCIDADAEFASFRSAGENFSRPADIP